MDPSFASLFNILTGLDLVPSPTLTKKHFSRHAVYSRYYPALINPSKACKSS